MWRQEQKGMLTARSSRHQQVAAGIRAQLDLHLERIRRALGFETVFIARVAGGERRVEAISAAPSSGPALRPGDIRPAQDCPVVVSTALRHGDLFAGQVHADVATRPPPFAAAQGVPVALPSGALFGVLGGIGDRTDAAPVLKEGARVIEVILDILHHEELMAQQVRGMIMHVMQAGLFRAVFQPVRDLDTGSVIYREGLTRLDDSLETDVPQLLAEAHAVGVGPALELAFARAILRAGRDWPDGAGIAVNLSETTLHSEAFREFLSEEAEPGLTVELTEHEPVSDYRALGAAVQRLRAAGVSLAIDDAGSGYTSLRHILDLKPDMLKIDAQLSARVDTDPEALALFRFLQRYCDETGTLLVTEGIERTEQLDALRAIGVRYVQGYHVGAPRGSRASGDTPDIA
jgi:EAL domain-containing protein (putative c-di-GMP-specific phosphodiesterase class I)